MKSVMSRPLFIPVWYFLPVSSMTLGTSLNHSELTSTSVKLGEGIMTPASQACWRIREPAS